MNTLYSLRVEGWVKFQFKLGCVEEQLFVVVYVDSYKNESVFHGRCLTNYCKIDKSFIILMLLGVLGQWSNFLKGSNIKIQKHYF